MTAKAKNSQVLRDQFITGYMTECLEEGKAPVSVFKFCKSLGTDEQEFYRHFGSLAGIRKAVWHSFFDQTRSRIEKDKAYESYSPRERWLSFFYTFFELLTLNRSYVAFAMESSGLPMEQMEQLGGLRERILSYATEADKVAQEEPAGKLGKHREKVFAEALWVQTLFLLRFWLKDESPGFEKTDMAIEKSVQTLFDLADTAPLERLMDFGKFLIREHFGKTA